MMYSIVYSKLRFSLLSHIVDVLVELYGAPNKMQFLNDGATDRAKLFLQVASECSKRRTLIVAPSEAVFNFSAEHLHILTNGLQRSGAVIPAVPGNLAVRVLTLYPPPLVDLPSLPSSFPPPFPYPTPPLSLLSFFSSSLSPFSSSLPHFPSLFLFPPSSSSPPLPPAGTLNFWLASVT